MGELTGLPGANSTRAVGGSTSLISTYTVWTCELMWPTSRSLTQPSSPDTSKVSAVQRKTSTSCATTSRRIVWHAWYTGGWPLGTVT